MKRFSSTALRRIKWSIAIILGLPIALFFLLSLLIYLPPIQHLLTGKVEQVVGKALHADVQIDHFGLSFPLNLSAQNIIATQAQQNAPADTLLHARTLQLDVALLPLFSGNIQLKGAHLFVSTIDTKQLLANVHLKGCVGRLGLQWSNLHIGHQTIQLSQVKLSQTDLAITLADSTFSDTTTSTAHWLIDAERLQLEKATVRLALPASLPTTLPTDTQQVQKATTTYIAAYFDHFNAQGGHIDIAKKIYSLQQLRLKRTALAYLHHAPGGTFSPAQPTRTIPADKKHEHADTLRAAYTYTDAMAELRQWQPFVTPTSPTRFNPDSITLTQVHFQVDSLRYHATEGLRLHVAQLSFKERSGFTLQHCSTHLQLDSILYLPDAQLQTPHSQIGLQLHLPLSTFHAGGAPLKATLQSQLLLSDLYPFLPQGMDLTPLQQLPQKTFQITSEWQGNFQALQCTALRLYQPQLLLLRLKGKMNLLSPQLPGLNLDYHLEGFSELNHYLQKLTHKAVKLPQHFTAQGTFSTQRDFLHLLSRLSMPQGRAQIKARLNPGSEQYDALIHCQHLQLSAFVPDLPLTPLTAEIRCQGLHFNPNDAHTKIHAHIRIDSLTASGFNCSHTQLQATLEQLHLQAQLQVNNAMAEGTISLQHHLSTPNEGTITANLDRLALHETGVTTDTVTCGGQVNLDYALRPQHHAIDAFGDIRQLYIYSSDLGFSSDDIDYDFHTTSDTTALHINSGDLDLQLHCPYPLDTLTHRAGQIAQLVSQQIGQHRLDLNLLRPHLPKAQLDFHAGRSNPLNDFLHLIGYQFKNLAFQLDTDPQKGMSGFFRSDSIYSGSFLLDQARLQLSQDSSGLVLHTTLENKERYNPNRFRLQADARILPDKADIQLQFFDPKGVKSVDAGAAAEWESDGLRLSLFPIHPLIAYRQFTINPDNYIFLGNKKQIRANINLLADDGTGLKIYSVPSDSINDITLSVNHVNLGELTDLLPSMPSMEGFLSGDFHMVDNHRTLSAMGDINVKNFVFSDAPIGNIEVGVTYLPTGRNLHTGNFIFSTDGRQVLFADGSFDDRAKELSVEGNLDHFPLPLLNGFMQSTGVALQGACQGNFNVKNSHDHLKINGHLQLEEAHILSETYGFDFNASNQTLDIVNGKLAFNDFKLYSGKESPLLINGAIDLTDPANARMNLAIKAQNFHLINAPKTQKSLVFGDVFADYTGTVRGPVNNLSVRGQLDILDRTNMTYILRDSPLTDQNSLEGLVDFVSFADSALVRPEPTSESNFDLALGIDINRAARFHCFLSEDGSSYAELNGGGHLTLRLTQLGEIIITGRVTAEGGEMKYQLPIIPLRTFHIQPESYVEFNGEATNPTLDIQAQEQMKVIVTEDNRQRAVLFNVGVHLTRPLNNMGLEFTIDAPEDLTMQNQLAAMTPDQRSKTAVAMMATGMYLGDDQNSGSGFHANNALNAFLQSEIQNIAGKALKSVDISLGVEEGRSLSGTQTTDYSFRFSKRLWNDRVRIVIGGRVSAGVEADNRAESIIDNLSLEYRIGKGTSRYVRLFYDRNAQDPLEGELINTGAGYSVRRGAEHFRELFFIRRKKNATKKQNHD